ncbi:MULTISPECIES: PASTA domain-containing protein [unclassified Micromonospora]|uniref:PASTA domain-containing protein n=1 Tax=unclassified Micromonospora TaxID=2617518 RepID=UPI0022B5F343|nr:MULTISPECIES: PASTA domain-containing protein [unclassified Micromonospora]MCZ7418393.1 PASTA domain-containing protein [Verrucosispora sp. WMMA2121]WBB92101.1 PASTA domain-containing protein [Verrucosispora sp. WMMC514]
MPDLVGLTVEAASQVATDHHVRMTSGDPDGPPLSELTSSGVWLITGQEPAAGTTMRRYGSMVVAVEEVPDNLAGDREPRRPSPRLDGLGAELEPATDSNSTR